MNKARIKELATAELVEDIRTLSAERWRAIYAGNPREGNRIYHRLIALEKELRKRGIEEQRQLLKLLEDADPGTRCWVAASVLDFAPAEAERVLSELARPPNGLIGFSAERTLEQWRAGTFKPL